MGYPGSRWNLNEFVAGKPTILVDPFGDVWHHMFPWEFQAEFNDLNIDINLPAYGWEMSPEDHRALHPAWNHEWESFFNTYPKPTPGQVFQQYMDMLDDDTFSQYLKKGHATTEPYPDRHTRPAFGKLVKNAKPGSKAAKLLNAIGPILWGIEMGRGLAGCCDEELAKVQNELGALARNSTQLQCQAAMGALLDYAECLGVDEMITGAARRQATLEVCTKFK